MKKLLLLSAALVHIVASAFLPEGSAFLPTWRMTGCELSFIENKGYVLCADKEGNGIEMTEREANFHYFFQKMNAREKIPCRDVLNNIVAVEDLKNMAIDFAQSALKESSDFEGRERKASVALDLYKRIDLCQKLNLKTTHGNIIFPDISAQENSK